MSILKVYTVAIILTFSGLNCALFAQSCDQHLFIDQSIDLPNSDDDQELLLNLVVQRDYFFPLACAPYFITFSHGNSSNYNRVLTSTSGETLPYNLFKNQGQNQILKGIETAPDSSGFLVGLALFPSSDYTQNYYLSFPKPLSASSVAKAEFYSDSLTVSLYSGTANNYQLEESKTLIITHTILPDLSLSLVQTGGVFDPNATSFTMDFGELQQGETQYVDLKVVSNSGYDLYLSSTNKGYLQHTTDNKSRVDYTLKVRGQRINIGNHPRRIARQNSPTSSSGDSYDLAVVIGDPAGKATGLYTDYITITAEARD